MGENRSSVARAAPEATDDDRLDRALAESEARYRALFEQSPIGVFTFDRRLKLTDCNLAFVRLARSKVEALVGLDLRTLSDPRILPAVERVLEGEPLYVEGPYVVERSGVEIEVTSWITPIRDAEGEVTGGLGLVEDVTERRAAQRALARSEAKLQLQMLQSDRLATVGTLAAGIAHEINNPLAYVMTNLEVVARHCLPEMTKLAASDAERERIARVGELVEQARHGAERMRRVVRDVKTFARGDDDSRAPVDVREILDAALQLVAHDLRQRAHLVRDFAPVPRVDANESRLGQVFLNLLVNALQALPDGGGQELLVRVRPSGDGLVVVEVKDTGEGIAPDVLPRVFDPFFTTKPIGVGTGLGLFVCQGIVTSLGGDIAIESEEGVGTTARVRLPVSIADTPGAPPVTRSDRTERHGARVLLVDDEASFGRALAGALEGEHEVVTLTSGQAAIDRLAVDADFDVILCDLMMPPPNGMDVWARVNAQSPALAERFVFVTGGVHTAEASAFLDAGKTHLEKPFALDVLRKLLARRATRERAEKA